MKEYNEKKRYIWIKVFTCPKVYVLAVPCPLSFMLFVILAMIMKYIYLSISPLPLSRYKQTHPTRNNRAF